MHEDQSDIPNFIQTTSGVIIIESAIQVLALNDMVS